MNETLTTRRNIVRIGYYDSYTNLVLLSDSDVYEIDLDRCTEIQARIIGNHNMISCFGACRSSHREPPQKISRDVSIDRRCEDTLPRLVVAVVSGVCYWMYGNSASFERILCAEECSH